MANLPETDLDLENDPNYVAYRAALGSGELDDFLPGTWVAFSGGELFASDTDREALFNQLKKGEGAFVHQVGVPEEVHEIPTPFFG